MTNATKNKGFLIAFLSSAAFGSLAFFTKVPQGAGMSVYSILVYRFWMASVPLLLFCLYTRSSLRVTPRQLGELTLLALFYVLSGVTQIEGLHHIDTGVGTTLQFSYPIFTPLIMFFVFKERITLRTALAIVLALVGVALLSGMVTGTVGKCEPLGVFLQLLAGFTYAVYLAWMSRSKATELDSSTFTFYIFFISAIMMTIFAPFTAQGLQTTTDSKVLLHLAMLALIPTALANITLTISVRMVGSTLVSVLSAMEPVTAMVLGILILNEKISWATVVGFIAIIIAVMLLIISPTGDTPCDNDDKKLAEA